MTKWLPRLLEASGKMFVTMGQMTLKQEMNYKWITNYT